MTITNPQLYCESLWDWGVLDGCFGGRIKPTDADGEVERHGRFLRFETKLPGTKVPQGQMITFHSLIATGVYTVVIIWGHPGKPEKITVMTPEKEMVFEDTTLEDLRNICKAWYEYANSFFPI